MASIDVGIHPDAARIQAHHFPAAEYSNRFSTLVCEANGGRLSIFIDGRNNRAVLDALQAALDEIRADMDAAAQTADADADARDENAKTAERDMDASAPLSVFYDGAHEGCDTNHRHNHSTAPLYDPFAGASDQVPTVMADWPAGPPGELAQVFGK